MTRTTGAEPSTVVPPTGGVAARPVRRYSLPVLAIIGVAGVVAWAMRPDSAAGDGGRVISVVKSGDLPITVLAEGNLQAIRSQEIRCRVEGQTTIIKLIQEGTFLTPEDVEAKRVLVELDSSRLRDDEAQQEVTVAGARASLTQAEKSYEIQKDQNESNIQAATLEVEFARMDLERYLGAPLAVRLGSAEVDFAALAHSEELGGAALQERRNIQMDIDLAGEEVARAEDTVEWTATLADKGYVTRTELDVDRLVLKRRQVERDKSLTALDLFMRYEFVKQAKQLFANANETIKELSRVRARADSELAKADAELKSNQATYGLREARLKKIKTQIKNCVIHARQPGLVIYASSSDWRGRAQNVIEEGATVRERQAVIQVPDTSAMAVDVKVHESSVKKIKPGQPVSITADAFPDLRLRGKVVKVAPLPDPQSRWLNPDLKVYSTLVAIEGDHRNLKPGMSAKAEILIDNIKNAVYVPVQAVHVVDGKTFCYLVTDAESRAQPVVVGATNDVFVRIIEGLEPGQRVVLRPRVGTGKVGPPGAGAQATAQAKGGDGAASRPAAASRPVKMAPPAAAPGEARGERPERGRPEGRDSERGARGGRQNMTPEQREQMRKRFENMTPKQREEMRRQFRERGGRRGGGDRAPGGAE